MGGHIDRCNNPDCHTLHLSYNSCRNRHCPKCQGHLSHKWIEKREEALLNTRYFHVVFTLPEAINTLALAEPKTTYNALFKAAWATIKGFAANPKFLGAKTGMTAVLHTWGQTLSLHPHLHCIVPAGGITQSGKWKTSKSKGKYLFDVKEMRKVFRAKYVAALREHTTLNAPLRQALFAKKWVINAEAPFWGPKQVIAYLGRYTHKIAISNHRLLNITNDAVCFSYKDYRQNGKRKEMTLSHSEFIRRFALHILPKGFTRIRHYGIMASGQWPHYKALADSQIGVASVAEKAPPSLHLLCPICKKGTLETVCYFDQRGPPKQWIEALKKQNK